MSDERLKPCPFCGGKAEVWYCGNGYYKVKCQKCGCSSPLLDDPKETENRWNTRQEPVTGECVEHSRMVLSPLLENYQYSKCGVDGRKTNYRPDWGAKMKGAEE